MPLGLLRRKWKLKLKGGASPAEIKLRLSLPCPSEKNYELQKQGRQKGCCQQDTLSSLPGPVGPTPWRGVFTARPRPAPPRPREGRGCNRSHPRDDAWPSRSKQGDVGGYGQVAISPGVRGQA